MFHWQLLAHLGAITEFDEKEYSMQMASKRKKAVFRQWKEAFLSAPTWKSANLEHPRLSPDASSGRIRPKLEQACEDGGHPTALTSPNLTPAKEQHALLFERYLVMRL